MKKIYSDEVVNESVKLYTDGISFSKIATILKMKRNNVKDILIKNNVWVENRDNLKIEFNDVEINDVLIKYRNGLSVQKICKLYNVSRTPIQKILKDKGILKKGHSDGIKINLIEEQKEKIKHLYLNEYKTSFEIAKELGLTGPFINKYLDKCGYRRTMSESLSIFRKGVKMSEKSKLNMSIAQKKFAMSGNRKQTGGPCKFYVVGGLDCQGTYEKFYIEKLINDGIKLPENGISITTPFGAYYPDFSYDDRLIEIKSDYTYDVFIGEKICPFKKDFNTNQLDKIKWVNHNVKPVEILIVDKRKNKIIKKEII
jgi:DNA invertase Pin-like site-specific DNA recombinase